MKILQGQGLSKGYGDVRILNNVSIHIDRSSRISIAGASGSGKTTLLKILAGLAEPDTGKVLFRSQKIEGPLTKLIAGHDKIGYLSQHYELRNNYRVEEVFDYSNRLDDQFASRLFELCKVTHLLKRRTDQLSGGERQRIALARVLITNPDVLLLDEPFSNLDLIQKTSLKKVLYDVIQAFDLSVALVSHDPLDLLPFGDRTYVMESGQIVQADSPQEIYLYPENNYVAGLFGPYAVITDQVRKLFESKGQHISQRLRYLRPEMMEVVPNQHRAIPGVIEAIEFLGAYWRFKISANGHQMFVNYSGNPLTVGQNVYLRLNELLLSR